MHTNKAEAHCTLNQHVDKYEAILYDTPWFILTQGCKDHYKSLQTI